MKAKIIEAKVIKDEVESENGDYICLVTIDLVKFNWRKLWFKRQVTEHVVIRLGDTFFFRDTQKEVTTEIAIHCLVAICSYTKIRYHEHLIGCLPET